MSFVDIEGLRLVSGKRLLLNDLTLDVERGRRVGLTGPSGCGKTTLLRSIVRRRLNPESSATRFRVTADPIAYAPQQDGDLRWGTPFDLMCALTATRTCHEDRIERSLRAADLGDAARRPNRYLSGGEKQRARLATAMVLGAKLVCADEPLTEVGLRQRWRVLKAWSSLLVEDGASLLMVSHDLDTLLYMCDEVCVLDPPDSGRDGGPRVLQISDAPHPRDDSFLSAEDIQQKRSQLRSGLYR